MKRPSRVGASLPMTFLIYTVEALFALAITLPGGLELVTDQRSFLLHDVGHAAWLERAYALVPMARAQGRSVLLLASIFMLVSPWLQLAWMDSTRGAQSVRRSLRVAAALYTRAWQVTGWLLLMTLLVAAGAWLLSRSVFLLPDTAGNAYYEDVALLLVVALLALWLPLAALLHDLARAGLASTGSAAQALRDAAGRLGSARVLLLGLASAAGGLSLRAVGLWLVQHLSTGPLLQLALQLICFTILFIRSVWLALAVACMHPSDKSREPND